MTGLDQRVARSGRTAARVIDGKAVIVVIDSRELHTLNEVGTFVWEALSEQGSAVSELVTAVETEFDVDRERAERDVIQFVDAMCELGAVRVEGGRA